MVATSTSRSAKARTNMSKNPDATPGVAQRYDTVASASATPGTVMVSLSFWGSCLPHARHRVWPRVVNASAESAAAFMEVLAALCLCLCDCELRVWSREPRLRVQSGVATQDAVGVA